METDQSCRCVSFVKDQAVFPSLDSRSEVSRAARLLKSSSQISLSRDDTIVLMADAVALGSVYPLEFPSCRVVMM